VPENLAIRENDDFFASFFSLVKRSGEKIITLFEKKNEESNIASQSTTQKVEKPKLCYNHPINKSPKIYKNRK